MSFTVNVATGGATGGNFSVSAPTNTNGDQLVAIGIQDQQDDGTSALAPPAGWTLYSHDSAPASVETFVWTKQASSEPSSYSFTCPAADSSAVIILDIQGASGTIETDSGYTSVLSSKNCTAASLTPLGKNRLIICVYSGFSASSQSFTKPSGTNQQGTTQNFISGGGNNVSLAVCTFTQFSGATPSEVGVWGGAIVNTGIQLALPSFNLATSYHNLGAGGSCFRNLGPAIGTGLGSAPFTGSVIQRINRLQRKSKKRYVEIFSKRVS